MSLRRLCISPKRNRFNLLFYSSVKQKMGSSLFLHSGNSFMAPNAPCWRGWVWGSGQASVYIRINSGIIVGKTVINILHIPQGSLIFLGYHLLVFFLVLFPTLGAWSKFIWPDSKVVLETGSPLSLTYISGRGRLLSYIFMDDLFGSAREIT